MTRASRGWRTCVEMDYDDVVESLGDFGPYQKRMIALIFLPNIFNAFGAPIANFVLGEQLFRCQVPGMHNDSYEHGDEIVNGTIPRKEDGSYKECSILVNDTERKCSSWVYDYSTFSQTVQSQFNLVCDDNMLHTNAIFMFFLGTLIATMTTCSLGDITGRRLLICISTSLLFIINVAMPFSPTAGLYTVFRFFDGFFGQTFYQTAYIIGIELVGPSKRFLVSVIGLEIYCLGEIILVIAAYFIRDWRHLQLAVSIPMAIPLIYWWKKALPESPRWLISRGRSDEALDILRYAAKVNKRRLPENITTLKVRKEDKGILNIIKELFHSKKLLIRWPIVTANWFIISMMYYGLTINVGKLGGDLYINFVIGVCAEAAGYALCLAVDFIGRKRMHLTVLIIASLACFVSMIPIFVKGRSSTWLGIALSMIGRLGISAAFGEIFLYTGELFPTVVRSLVMSSCNLGARIGSTTAPFLYKISDGEMGKAIPLLVFGILTITVCLLSVTLPETKHKKMLEVVSDVERENHLNGDAIKEQKDEDDETSPL